MELLNTATELFGCKIELPKTAIELFGAACELQKTWTGLKKASRFNFRTDLELLITACAAIGTDWSRCRT